MSIRVDESHGKYMHDYITKICDEVGTRSPGSEGEKKGADMTAEFMKDLCNEVEQEEFRVAPKAFLGWIKIDVILVIASVILFLVVPVASGSMMVIAVVLAVGEFIFYFEVLDPFLAKKISTNTIGTILPAKESKQTIIFSGHIDSPFQFSFIKWWKGLAYVILIASAFIILFSFAVVSILNAVWFFLFNLFNPPLFSYITSNPFTGVWIFMICISPLIVLCYFFTTWVDTLGAGDNLSGVAVALGVAKFLKEAKETKSFFPKHIKVKVIAFGSEEIGLRGAKAYANAHKDECKAENTIVINLETIVDPAGFYIGTKDLNSTVKLSKKVAEEMHEVATSLELNPKYMSAPIGSGSSDSAALARKGIETICILGVNISNFRESYFNHYHTIRDTPDKVDPKAMTQVLNACLHYLKMKDEEVS